MVIVQTQRSAHRLRRLVWVLFLVGCAFGTLALLGAESLLARLESFAHLGTSPDASLRLTFVNRNHFAGYLELVCWLGVGLSFALRGAKRWLLLGLSSYVAVAALLSLSRGGFIGLTAAFLFFAVLTAAHPDDRRMLPWTAGFGALVAASMAWLVDSRAMLERLATLLDPWTAGRGRLEIWAASVRLIEQRPWLGFGFGTYQYVSAGVLPASHARRVVEHAHSEYLERMVELGLLGAALGLILLAVFLSAVIRGLRRQPDPTARRIGLGALSGCMALLVHNLFEFQFVVPANALLFAVCAAVALLCGVSENQPKPWLELHFSGGGKRLSTATVLVAALIAAVLSLQPYRGHRLLDAARERIAADDLNGAEASLHRALALEPGNAEPHALMGDLVRRRAQRTPHKDDRRRLLERALLSYDDAIARNSLSGPLQNRRASLLVSLERPQEALSALERALDLDPVRAYHHYDLGQLLRRQGDNDRAYLEYRRAIELSERYLEPILQELRRTDPDPGHLRRVVPERPDRRLAFGRFLIQNGEPWAAVRELAWVLAEEPSEAAALSLLRALGPRPDSGSAEPSLAAFRAEILRDRPHADAVPGGSRANTGAEVAGGIIRALLRDVATTHRLERALARLYEECGEGREAAIVYRKGLERHPGAVELSLDLAALLARERRVDEALELLEAAAVRAFRDARIAFSTYQILSREGESRRALDRLKQAVRWAPRNPQYRFQLGAEYRHLGLYQQAADEWKQVLAANPDHAATRRGLQALHAELGLPAADLD